MKTKEALSPETKVLHAPYPKTDPYGALSMPVYRTVAYEFDSAEDMEDAFTGRTTDPAYSRISNPTVQHYEEQVRALTGAGRVFAFNSGMAAISNALTAVAYAGANIVASPHLFGNSYSLLASTLAAFGVEPRFCDLTVLEAVEEHLDGNTCAVFLEVVTNPQLEVADLKSLSVMCRKYGVPLIADTTAVPPPVFNARDFGVDIEIVSATKYFSGGATSLGGLVLDHCSFDWMQSEKLESMAGKCGGQAFSMKLYGEVLRNLGAYMTPDVAYMQSLGLETLSVRYDRASRTCLRLAREMQEVPGVVSVNYPGLESNRYYAVSRAQFGDRPGAMFTFDLQSKNDCYDFINKLRLIKRATNLFDNKTLAIHPYSTIFGTFPEAVRRSMDIRPETIRISVGLEDPDDLLNDVIQALR